ncbi:hypothetical protein [Curtobacterium sp. RRHDQ10]|uniref:hypothetical protein n=1 Tax=Curtobacterium phyllosphaerae TaxID=3413379 RepID=UPI003BF2118B
MLAQKTFLPFVAVGATVLLLAGCSGTSSRSSGGDSSSTTSASASAEPSKAAAAGPQPFNVGGLLAGNAQPTFGDGEPGKVSVVAQGPLEKDMIGGAELSFAYRNNTGKAIAHVDFTGSARANGALVASGSSQDATPAQVLPGEVGFAMLYFDDAASVPDTGVTYDFSATTSPANSSSYNTAPLKVSESNNNGTAIIGSAVNQTGKPLTGPYSVDVYCFTGNDLTGRLTHFASQDGDVAPDGQVTFSATLNDTKCDSYTFGVSGYFK